ncbi:MAG TPA: cytochrome c biogenesis protein CcsA [Abditibacteriaceae bacterium]|nr:cytochrome c biogenesis protein CcsA [Abditibacteriaceae bacterium]
MISFFSHHEDRLLLGAVLSYLIAMCLLWIQLFARTDEPLAPSRLGRSTAIMSGHALLCLGAALHFCALLGQGSSLFAEQAGVAGLFGWIVVVAYLAVGKRLGRLTLGAFVTPVALVAAMYSLTAPHLHQFAPPPRLEAHWLIIHVILTVLGYVALAFAFAASLLYLLQEGLLKRKQLSGLWQKLPSLQVADNLIYQTTTFGLAMLTLGIFTGIVWQQRHQPNYAVWQDPKVLFSLATWVMFAAYLGTRQWLGWRGRRSNLVVVYGFVLLVISFLGTPHLLPGVAR